MINSKNFSNSYAREKRIIKKKDFSAILRLRPINKTSHFSLYIRSNQSGKNRFGIIVSKRFAPRSVTRSTIKRIARELFRHSFFFPYIDCVVRLYKSINVKSDPAVTSMLKHLLRSELQELLKINDLINKITLNFNYIIKN